MRALFLMGLFCGLLGSCGTSSSTDKHVVKLAPSIKAKTIDGLDFELASLKGQHVIIAFWASWCGPCRRELPALIELYTVLKQSGQSLEVVSIGLEKNTESGLKYGEQMNFPWPHKIIQETRFVRFNDLASAYDVTEIPSLFLINPAGEIVRSHSNVSEIKAYLK